MIVYLAMSHYYKGMTSSVDVLDIYEKREDAQKKIDEYNEFWKEDDSMSAYLSIKEVLAVFYPRGYYKEPDNES